MNSRSPSMGRKLLFALVTTAAFFVALELGGRLVHGWNRHWLDCHRPHPVLGWSLREGWAGKWSWTGGYSRINRQGIRDDAPVLPKQPGERRLLILGDSVTFGAGVRTCQAYPSLLQEELRRRGDGKRVLNGGVTSYDPSQEADWLACFGWGLEPDELAIAFCPNDVCPSDRFGGPRAECPGGAAEWLAERSIVACKLQRAVWRLRAQAQGKAGTVLKRDQPLVGVPFVAEAYERIAAEAAARNVPVTLIVFPAKTWLTGNDDALPASICALGGRFGWRVVDLREAFAAEPIDDLYLPHDPIHPSVYGHAVAARALADALGASP